MPGVSLLLVHAHPDDETITCGGLMALAVGAGVPVTLVTCNRGELGEVIPRLVAQARANSNTAGMTPETS